MELFRLKVVSRYAIGDIAQIDLARKFNPDVIVLDVAMSRMNDVEATRQIKTEFPGERVVALSMCQDKQIARTMIEAGADAFLTKTVSISVCFTDQTPTIMPSWPYSPL